MGRARRARLWIALPGAIAINGVLLALLWSVEAAKPVPEEPPIIVLRLESPPRQPLRRPSARRSSSPSRTSAQTPAAPSPIAAPGASGVLQVPEGGARVDPVWRVDPKAVERWRIEEGSPAFHWGRFHRACKGLSSEHMTDEEKARCHGGWREAESRAAVRPLGR